MHLTVGQAARTLGVTPNTIRRWTATGFLPCERTAGGHRRIARDDIDELRRAIGGSGHLQARQAREREVDTLAQALIDLAGMLDWQELLATLARHVTHLCNCGTCAISGYDATNGSVHLLAEYDAGGQRLPQTAAFHIEDYPLTRRVLESKEPAVVNVDDRDADPAEVRLLRRYGDQSVLIVPLVVGHDAIGILEAIDSDRPRFYSPQELRLMGALAGSAAVAMRNVELYRDAMRAGDAAVVLPARLKDLADRLAGLGDLREQADWPDPVARLACDLFAARSCLIVRDGRVVGAAVEAVAAGEQGMSPAPDGRDAASILTSARSGPVGAYELTVTLLRPAEPGEKELLDVLAALAAGLG
jgi:excisionase family DNA binding protein